MIWPAPNFCRRSRASRSTAERNFWAAIVPSHDSGGVRQVSQLLHAGFAVLCVLAIWVFVRRWGSLPAAVAATAMGTCGWLMYLAPLAYVEMPMLFVSIVMVGVFVSTLHAGCLDVKASILIGVLLGLAGGYKYTALAMLGPGVILALVLAGLPTLQIRKIVLYPAATMLAAAVMLSPYLIRNYCWTGNCVFPFGYEYFGGRSWDSQLAERWRRGHAPRADQRTLAARLDALYSAGLRNVILDPLVARRYRAAGLFDRADQLLHPKPILDLPQFGLAVLFLPWVVFFTRQRSLSDALLLVIFLAATGIWLCATHLQARFLIPWLAVLPFLIGRSTQALTQSGGIFRTAVVVAVLAVSAGINFHDGYHRYVQHVYFKGQRVDLFGGQRWFLEGQIPGYEYLEAVNARPGARTMLLGEARPFYVKGQAITWTVFNANEFARHAGRGKGLGDLKAYLAQVRPDFLYVNWSEISRLAGTYGFEKSVTPNLFKFLSSPARFSMKRIGSWGPMIRCQGTLVPARTLYQFEYPAPRTPPKK